MSTASVSKSAAVRARLKHPVIDSDGHMIEFEPGFVDYLKTVGGPSMVDRFYSNERNTGSWGKLSRWYQFSPEERRYHRPTRAPWWALPTKNTLDRATAVLPKLLHERMDDIGLDFTVLYPSLGLSFPHTEDAELRQATCRALNMFCADYFREYADRMTPAACIPMHTPQEAVAELEFAVKELGSQSHDDGRSCTTSSPSRRQQRSRMPSSTTPSGSTTSVSIVPMITTRCGPNVSN